MKNTARKKELNFFRLEIAFDISRGAVVFLLLVAIQPWQSLKSKGANTSYHAQIHTALPIFFHFGCRNKPLDSYRIKPPFSYFR